MSQLLDVRNVRVPRQLALDAHAHLQRVGRAKYEGFALWAGAQSGEAFNVTHTLIPEQRLIRSRNGVCVAIGPEELHRLNVWLYENKATLIAQIHSHPTEAYHSETDDDFPIATAVGSLSLVVPDFARRPFSLEECAVYRLSPAGRWDEVYPPEVRQLITLTDQVRDGPSKFL